MSTIVINLFSTVSGFLLSKNPPGGFLIDRLCGESRGARPPSGSLVLREGLQFLLECVLHRPGYRQTAPVDAGPCASPISSKRVNLPAVCDLIPLVRNLRVKRKNDPAGFCQ
jgi:hypothetical protein